MSALLRLKRSLRPLPTLQPSRPKPLPPHFFSRLQTPSRTRPQSRCYKTYNSYPPPSHERANMTILYTLIGANLSIFGYECYLETAAMQGNIAPWSSFMQNMTLNLEDFRAGRWWTILTSTFTHLDLGHVLGNMVTVYFLGRFLASAPIITPARFLIITIGSSVCGSLGHLATRYVQTQNSRVQDTQRSLGFSGTIMGISSVAACLAPTATVHLYAILPVPMWLLVVGYAIYDGLYLTDARSQIGHAGHLGGLGFGLGYYFLRLRGLRL